ncbi:MULTISPECIES: LLM class flavin-dependent oxidoreductase [Streptomyces]|uniref:LLM class flavin-dependent oxidoreductase n=1 Tax=Streptomyces koelreuteriae TaxID=2838015 RepID=A0ABX8G1Y2_9ACTN|nr:MULTISPECIES: LLM class flavin-dependent oxidoreductase [Streptomyces]QWB27333.1 LLM class flavin-dependent oxidoreductase [Streptomyces koelreuteriae]UUA10417.1 LLM class flavin-dependent oxidoreductase [Streptomyces koelreuteriae]UUA18024.1 LLM class flavin-dependent oxidoreductase [Streptomyces sp. CRCS-T-1]
MTDASAPRRPLRFNAFAMNCVSHINHGQWVRDDTSQTSYTDLETWTELARTLERGYFDALFLADVIGTYDTYRGSRDTAVREGLQIPVNDPSLLVAALAHATEHLGLAFTQSVLQEPPYNFARRLSTLDHLTKGRVAWNVVTSYLESAARGLGLDGLPLHDERYERAEEYTDVLYQLLEGSWEENAVLRDRERRVYADPARIHDVHHEGRFYRVNGPHLSEPSPQRTPILFQAGSSERGREFAARNAEAVFLGAVSPEGARTQVEDVRARAVAYGRQGGDILFFQGLTLIVGSTEEEAERKLADYREHTSLEGFAAHMSGSLQLDLSQVDFDAPVGEIDTNGVQGFVRSLVEGAPDKTWTFGEVLRARAWTRPVAGVPERIADELERWRDAGVDGINLAYVTSPGTFTDFADQLAPVLQKRGLLKTAYEEGTLRQKLFGRGDRLPASHPAARHRRG